MRDAGGNLTVSHQLIAACVRSLVYERRQLYALVRRGQHDFIETMQTEREQMRSRSVKGRMGAAAAQLDRVAQDKEHHWNKRRPPKEEEASPKRPCLGWSRPW